MRIVKCVKKGSELKVVPVDAEGNVQFPKDLRKEGKMFAVEGLTQSGSFWKVEGQIFELNLVGGKTKAKKKEDYIQFSEMNDNEGETWNFFIPINTPGVQNLMNIIDHLNNEGEVGGSEYSYKKVSATTAKTLCEQEGSTEYMSEFNMVKMLDSIPNAICIPPLCFSSSSFLFTD